MKDGRSFVRYKGKSLKKLAEYKEKVQKLLVSSTAPETRRAYASRLKSFFSWCEHEGIAEFPVRPETVAAYIAHLADRNASCSTVAQIMSAVAAAHRTEGLPSPTENMLVQKTLKGYRREHGFELRRPSPATSDIVMILLNALYAAGDSAMQIRDRAMIAVGFAGAFRRSELAALDISNLEWTVRKGREICLITVRRSKTDQEGHGMTKAIFPAPDERFSPTALLKKWIECAGITEGPLFRPIVRGGHVQKGRMSAQTVRDVMVRTGKLAGLNLNLSAHSLRSGFVTTTIRQGKSERAIMNQTGHRSVSVLREYFRREDAVEDNAADGVM